MKAELCLEMYFRRRKIADYEKEHKGTELTTQMKDFGAEISYNELGKLRDWIGNGMPNSHMGNPG